MAGSSTQVSGGISGPGTKTDGFSLRISGTPEVAQRLASMGDVVAERLRRVLQTLGEQLARHAGARAPVGARQRGRRGGRLKGSFVWKARPSWEQMGIIGGVVRSKAKYHHFVEFGVNRPNVQVVLHRDTVGKRVTKGKRYRDDGRVREGVRVSSYRRDIRLPSNPILGDATRAMKPNLVVDCQRAISRLLESSSGAGGGA